MTHRARLLSISLLSAAALMGASACSGGGCSGPLCVDGGDGNNPPGAPTGVSITSSGTQATITWTPGANATSHRVTLTTPTESTRTQSTSGTTGTATFTGLTPGSTYTGQVFAVNANGETPSASVVTTLPALTGDVRGTLTVDGAGRGGVAVALVSIADPSQAFAQTTSPTGTYAFLQIEPGAYALQVLPSDFTLTVATVVVNVTAGVTVTRDFAGTAQRVNLQIDQPISGLQGTENSLQIFELVLTAGSSPPAVAGWGGGDPASGPPAAVSVTGLPTSRDHLVARGMRLGPAAAGILGAGALQSELVVSLAGGTGDADLCVTPPGSSGGQCSIEVDTNDESLVFPDPPAGTWVIEVIGFLAFDGATLQATLSATPAACIVGTIQAGEAVSGSVTARAECALASGQYYDIWELQGSAGDPVLVDLTASGGDTYLGITRPGANLSGWDSDEVGCGWEELLACNDDFFDPEGPFSLDSRAGLELPEDGPFWVVATRFAADDVGPYDLQVRPAVPVTVENHLISPVRLFFNDEFGGTVDFDDQEGAFIETLFAPATGTLVGVWEVWRTYFNDDGDPLGVQAGGQFSELTNPGSATYTIDNVVGQTTYWAPIVSNQTTLDLLQAVNWGLAEEVRCFCTVLSGESDYRMGYYLLVDGSNMAVFQAGSAYSGNPLGIGTVDPGTVATLSGRTFVEWVQSAAGPGLVASRPPVAAGPAASGRPGPRLDDGPRADGPSLVTSSQRGAATRPAKHGGKP